MWPVVRESRKKASPYPIRASSVTTLNPQRYDFEGKTVTIASTYIKPDGMVPDRITDTYRLLKRIEEVQTAFYVNVVFKEVDAGNYY